MKEGNYSTKKCVILIGCMGSGKSTIGERLSKETQIPWCDTDHFIEKKEQCSLSELFQRKGDAYFRNAETEFLRQLIANPSQQELILSTGGGIILRKENRELLRQLGFVVWLNVAPDILYQRIGRNHDRPLLQTPNPLQTLKEIYQERSPLYEECAHLIVDTHPLTFDEISCGIIESARHYFATQSSSE